MRVRTGEGDFAHLDLDLEASAYNFITAECSNLEGSDISHMTHIIPYSFVVFLQSAPLVHAFASDLTAVVTPCVVGFATESNHAIASPLF